MSTEKDLAYYEDHPDELTDEIAATLMFGGTIQGETDPSDEGEEGGKAPEAAAENKGTEADQQQSEKPDDKPVVLAKDGKHTIPYEELEQARAEAKRWEEASRDKDRLIEQLQSAKAKDEQQGSTEATDELIASVKQEYPLLAEFMEKLVDGRIKGLQQQVSESLKPIRQSEEERSIEAHFAAIRNMHSDLDSLINSGKVQEWVKTLPAYARSAANYVLEQGTAQDVIDLLTDYKASTGTPAKPLKEDIAKKAAEAVSKAKANSEVPTSLSSIPAGGLPASEELGNLDGMSDTALLSSFMNLDTDKINERLNRML